MIHYYLLFILYCLTVAPAQAINDYTIKINIPSRKLELYYNNNYIKEYSVGVGKSSNTKTPIGHFAIDKKIINPKWQHPYDKSRPPIGNTPENPLGLYWLGFQSGSGGSFGIHGTNDESSIGKFVSHGCVRMHNSDIKELFELIPLDSEVFVMYERYDFYFQDNKLMLTIYPDPYQMGMPTRSDILTRLSELIAITRLKFHESTLSTALKTPISSTKHYYIADLIQ